MNKSMNSLKKIGKILGTAIAAIIIVLIVLMLFFKFAPGYGFYIVRTGSMAPSINPGDIVFTHKVGEVRPGNIITFEANGEIVTHRAVSITNGQITTKGDANKVVDPGTVTISEVKGVGLFKLPAIGYITNLTNSRSGWFLLIIVPAVALVFFIVKKILKEAFKDDKKKPVTVKNGVAGTEPKAKSKMPDVNIVSEKPTPVSTSPTNRELGDDLKLAFKQMMYSQNKETQGRVVPSSVPATKPAANSPLATSPTAQKTKKQAIPSSVNKSPKSSLVSTIKEIFNIKN
jgi:signal peptidase I